MMRAFLLFILVLGGCTVSRPSATTAYQAEGVTVTLAVRTGLTAGGIVGGELLAVEPNAFLVDAVNQIGEPVRVVRVPMQAVTRGTAFVGTPPRGEIRSVVDTPVGMRRVARLGRGGRARGVDLRRLSRFPYGVEEAVLARLLEVRVQTEVADLDFAPIRSTLN